MVALAGRNEPCPCGSGTKYKRCCGHDRATEAALEHRLVAIEEIARFPFLSRRLVPDSDAFDAWVGGLIRGDHGVDVDAGVAAMGDEEAVRIVSVFLELLPDEWDALSARCADDREAVGALLGGAVAAGIRDLRPVDRDLILIVEESDDLVDDPLEALATCLDGEQLWDRREGAAADRAIGAIPDWLDDDAYDVRWHATLASTAVELASDWHRRRLARLVARIERALPLPAFPKASAAIRRGCEQFAVDDATRARLAATLLGDMVGRETLDTVRAGLLAA